MQKKVTSYFLVAIFITALLMGISSYSIMQRYYKTQNKEIMLAELKVMDTDDIFLKGDYTDFAKKYLTVLKARMTIIDKTGAVVYDSDAKTTENHENRPEVVKARQKGIAFVSRYSHTQKQMLYYAAKAYDNGMVIRLSRSQKVMDESLYHMAGTMAVSMILCVIVALLLAFYFSRNTIVPMARLRDHMKKNTQNDQIEPLDTKGLHDEVLELATAYNAMISKLNSQMQEIEQLQNMRSEFVANVSHELKTPLTSIRGFVETLKNGAIYKEDVAMRFLNIIDIEADRLQNLIADILFLSKIEKMDGEDKGALFCLTDLTYEVMEMLQVQAQEKAVDLLFTPPCEVWIHADESKIKQLMINLVSNAIKYNKDEGKVYIRIRKPKENHVEIQVSDTGIGMQEEDLNRVFERFYCVDKGRSQKNGGTGLGLSIVKHIANLYGGNVIAESEVGRGSSFIVTLCVETLLKEKE